MGKRFMVFVASVFLSVGIALAQTQVSGTVTSSEDGQPVVGATVKVAGTNQGTITDLNGHFSLQAPANARLEVSYIGMTTQTVKATRNMAIVLDANSQVLDDVMVVAYGTTKKSAYTGSASEIKSELIEKRQWTGRVCLTLLGERNLTPWSK